VQSLLLVVFGLLLESQFGVLKVAQRGTLIAFLFGGAARAHLLAQQVVLLLRVDIWRQVALFVARDRHCARFV